MAVTRSFSSWLSRLWQEPGFAFNTFPRSGKDGLVLVVAALFGGSTGAVTSTRNNSVSSTDVDLQSASLPGKFKRRVEAFFLLTSVAASRWPKGPCARTIRR